MSMDAKKEVLRKLIKEMRDEMGGPVHQKLKKVSVVSDSEEGLEKGLNKAEEILKKFHAMKGDSNPYHSLDKGGPEISNEGEQTSPISEGEQSGRLDIPHDDDLGELEGSLEDSVDENEMIKKMLKKK